MRGPGIGQPSVNVSMCFSSQFMYAGSLQAETDLNGLPPEESDSDPKRDTIWAQKPTEHNNVWKETFMTLKTAEQIMSYFSLKSHHFMRLERTETLTMAPRGPLTHTETVVDRTILHILLLPETRGGPESPDCTRIFMTTMCHKNTNRSVRLLPDPGLTCFPTHF